MNATVTPIVAGGQPTKTAYVSFSNQVNRKTTEALLGFIGQLNQKGITEVHLALSTPGGAVSLGLGKV